jgi:hypothetical protein
MAAFHRFRGNNVLMWEAVRWYAGDGFEVLQLGRTSLDHIGLRNYKCRWGAEEQTTDYLKFDLRKKSFVLHYNRINGWYNMLFRLMPRPISRVFGAFIYNHLS